MSNSKKPLVSICIPTYNRVNYLKQALNSAVNQTYRNIEIIVCDNCSQDLTFDVVKSFTDPRIRYYRNISSIQPTSNWHKSIAYAKGEWVTLLGDDDLLDIHYVNTLLLLATKKKSELARCRGSYIDSTGKIIGEYRRYPSIESLSNFMKNRMTGIRESGLSGYLFKKSLYLQARGIIDVGFSSGLFSDDYLWYRLCAHNKFRIFSTNKKLWYWRIHQDTLGSTFDIPSFRSNIDKYINLLLKFSNKYKVLKFVKDDIANRYGSLLLDDAVKKYLKKKYPPFLFFLSLSSTYVYLRIKNSILKNQY